MFRIVCYKPGILKPSFYIQSKGHHAGRPLKEPIPNCFAVYTESEILFGLVYALYKGKRFEYFIHGTIIPTIRITDVRELITNNLKHSTKSNHLKAIQDIDRLKELTRQKLLKLDEMQRALCYEALRG